MSSGLVIDLPVDIDIHCPVPLAPQAHRYPADRSVAIQRERDSRLELLAPARARGLAGVSVGPELPGIRDKSTAATADALPLGYALVVIDEHGKHVFATLAAHAEGDLYRTTANAAPEKRRKLHRHAVANMIVNMHRHIVPDARTNGWAPVKPSCRWAPPRASKWAPSYPSESYVAEYSQQLLARTLMAWMMSRAIWSSCD